MADDQQAHTAWIVCCDNNPSGITALDSLQNEYLDTNLENVRIDFFPTSLYFKD